MLLKWIDSLKYPAQTKFYIEAALKRQGKALVPFLSVAVLLIQPPVFKNNLPRLHFNDTPFFNQIPYHRLFARKTLVSDFLRRKYIVFPPVSSSSQKNPSFHLGIRDSWATRRSHRSRLKSHEQRNHMLWSLQSSVLIKNRSLSLQNNIVVHFVAASLDSVDQMMIRRLYGSILNETLYLSITTSLLSFGRRERISWRIVSILFFTLQ